MLGLFLGVGVFLVTVVIGVPIAVRLARPTVWSRRRPVERIEPAAMTWNRAFEPLNLGPDLARWPSEIPWPSSSTLPTPDWPSKSWDDEHFGAFWRDGRAPDLPDRGFHAMAARHLALAAQSAEDAASSRAASETARAEQRAAAVVAASAAKAIESKQTKQRGPAPKPQAAPARPAPQQKPQPPVEQAQRPQQPSQRQPSTAPQPQVAPATTREPSRPEREAASRPPTQAAQPQRKAPPPPQPATKPAAGSPPSREEVEQLVATVGLAGAVQQIMGRTGWDFRQAAQYLAKVRQGG